MITYDPPEFREEFLRAVAIYKEMIGDDVVQFFDLVYDPTLPVDSEDDCGDQTITPSTSLVVGFAHGLGCDSTLGDAVRDLLDLPQSRLVGLAEVVCPSRYLMRVEPVGYIPCLESAERSSAKLLPTGPADPNKKARVHLVAGATLFGYAVAAEGIADKYLPEILDGEYFVEVAAEGIELTAARELAEAYLFELSSSIGIHLCPTARPDSILVGDENEEVPAKPLRPLLTGRGVAELIALYNTASRSFDRAYTIISLVKAIEYVSRTVLQQTAIEKLRAKLCSERALAPDANFLLELQATALALSKLQRSDRDALRIAIVACADALELARLRPAWAPELVALSIESNAKDQEQALDLFAERVVATRNQIVHAKADYVPTGKEVPQDKYYELSECLRILATQAIRWYASRDESMRVA